MSVVYIVLSCPRCAIVNAYDRTGRWTRFREHFNEVIQDQGNRSRVLKSDIFVAGCGVSETTPTTGRMIDRTTTSATSPVHATFLKVSPELASVIDSRNSLLRTGVMSSDNSELLRASAASYRQSLLTLRRKFFDLELAVGAESVKRLVDFVISQGLVLAPEVMADIELNSSMSVFPMSRES